MCNVQHLINVLYYFMTTQPHLEVYLSIGQAICVYLVQKVNIFYEQVENWNDNFLPIAIGSL